MPQAVPVVSSLACDQVGHEGFDVGAADGRIIVSTEVPDDAEFRSSHLCRGCPREVFRVRPSEIQLCEVAWVFDG